MLYERVDGVGTAVLGSSVTLFGCLRYWTHKRAREQMSERAVNGVGRCRGLCGVATGKQTIKPRQEGYYVQ